MKTGTETDGDRTLTVRFGGESGVTDRIADRFGALDRDETPAPLFEVVLKREDDLHRVTRPKNVELLQTLAREHPESIRATARLVDRDVRQVHRNLEELADLGLVAFDEEGCAKRPRVWYDRIRFDIPIGAPEDVEPGDTVAAG
jgi:predicted transcriptional regulator